jgi:hypothetical protein
MARKRKILYAAGAVALMVVLFFWRVSFNAGPNILRESDIDSARIFAALNQYYFDTGRLPTREQGLEPLLPEYIHDRQTIVDAWDNPYIYEVYININNVKEVRLTTYGADGVSGGEGDNKDIVYEYGFPRRR